MDNWKTYIIIFCLVIVGGLTPYLRKFAINTNDGMPIDLFWIITSVFVTTFSCIFLSCYKKDEIYALMSIILLVLCVYLYYDKVKEDVVNKKYYLFAIATGLIFAITGYLYLILVREENVSYITPIISPLTLLYVYLLGVLFFEKKDSKNVYIKTVCVIVIGIAMAIFQLAK